MACAEIYQLLPGSELILRMVQHMRAMNYIVSISFFEIYHVCCPESGGNKRGTHNSSVLTFVVTMSSFSHASS